MDVGSATSASLYNYQATLKSGGQTSAVLQALDSAYTSASASVQSASDPTSALLGASTVGALAIGVSAVNQAAGSSGAISGLQSPTFGGLDAHSATSLLAGLGTSASASSGGLQGFATAVTSNATLALQAYQTQQAYTVSTPGAQTSPSSTPTTTLAGSASPVSSAPAAPAPAAPTQDQDSAAAQLLAAQAALNPAALSLLA